MNDNNKNMKNLEELDVIVTRNIKEQQREIGVLYSKFQNRINERSNKRDHSVFTLGFGMFLSEYILKIKTDSIEINADNLLLDCRRLCEVFIVSKYINKNNLFNEVMDYCNYDRYNYLENLKKMTNANKKMFPALKDFFYFPKSLADEQAEIDRCGKKGKKMPQIIEMAKNIDYEEEYSSFYKITSKLLHFCPFSLSGDMLLETRDSKFNFFKRIEMYLIDIKKELDSIYEKTNIKAPC